NGCCVIGGYVYRGGKYAAMFGKYFFVDDCSGLLQTLKKDTGSSWSYISEGDFNDYDFGTFGEDRFGELYVGGFNSGTVYKIKDADCTPTAYIYDKDTMYVCGDSVILSTPLYDSLQYEWFYNGALVADANSNELISKQNGWYSVHVTADAACSNTSTDVYVFLSSTENISIAGLPTFICNNYYPSDLSGHPSGGYFTGKGISGNLFYPDSVLPGDHLISYNYLTSYGCTIRKEKIINVVHCNSDSPVLIAPNPAANFLTVDFSFSENQVSEITIYDATGKLCLKENLLIVYGTMQHTFNIATLSSGVYTFQLKNSRVLIKEKFVIEKAK
ncbi:MAG: T9SS type A sorting domain-containing protein, partial [Bacteroidota bacterium]